MQTYAIISDIHGNLHALLAVMKDIKSREIRKVINLGDHFYGAMEPEGVAEILRENPMICISGNTDRAILESLERDGTESHKPEMKRVKGELSNQTIKWLKQLPGTASVDDLFFACHGTPESDNEYLLEKVTDKGVFVYNDEELLKKTAAVKERIILCGHSHVNRAIYLSNNKIILNPGSVGLPAYLGSEKYQYRFAMESMIPHAKYAVVRVDGQRIDIDQINVYYDWNAAASIARSNGNENWARFLITGRMPKDLRVD